MRFEMPAVQKNRISTTALLCILFLLLFSGIALSAPVISGTSSSSFSNGSSVTISGSGFGSSGPNVVIFDDFEKGQSGQTIKTGSGSAAYGQWDATGSPCTSSTIYYTNSTSVSGSLSFQAATSTDNYGLYLESRLPGGATDVFISWWLYLPSGDNFPGYDGGRVNWKQMWMMGSGTTDDDIVLPTFVGTSPNTVSNYIINGNDSRDWSKYIGLSFSRGTWTRLWTWVHGVPGGTGHIDYWQLQSNGVHQLSNQDGAFLKSGGQYERVRVNAYGGATKSHPTFDDVYIASGPNARARVEIGNSSSYNSCSKMAILTPTSWSNSQIVATVRTGLFRSGETAYLFVVDANGNTSSGKAITIGQGSDASTPTPPAVDNAPSINISSPTSNSSYATSSTLIDIAGVAIDDNGVSSVSWTNSTGGDGSASYNSGNWSISGIVLQPGNNVITITARDTAGQTATDTLTVNCNTGSDTSGDSSVDLGADQATWNANKQTGDMGWSNSIVTYCVRLLLTGDQIDQEGNSIKLGFQGRSSGSYTIQRVSIAERDTTTSTGNVVDSTWTRVTFDKEGVSGWATTDVVVPAGTEKVSDAIKFNIQTNKDYYVTFNIATPSVYLDPPSGYQELYFQGEDHTQDLDWSGLGFLSTRDYHALSNIYITNDPTAPIGLHIQ